MVIAKPCVCSHKETAHKYLYITIENHIQLLVNGGTLIPQHHPDRMEVVGYICPAERGDTSYSPEHIRSLLQNLRDKYSSCRHCNCQSFKMDNLKYLEECCEHKTSQIIH